MSVRPSGEKCTERSCSGVLVTRRVVANSVEVTKTSPRRTNATSLPFGDTANSLAPVERVWVRRSAGMSSAISMFTLRASRPRCMK